jgi:hypothetical protein
MELEIVHAPVKNLQFSNKGFHLAASWQGKDFCRVYSLHRACEAQDVTHGGNQVESFAFDYYGQFLMTCAAGKISIFYYRDFQALVGGAETQADIAMFDD